MEASKMCCFAFIFESRILQTFNKHLAGTYCVPHIVLGSRKAEMGKTKQ